MDEKAASSTGPIIGPQPNSTRSGGRMPDIVSARRKASSPRARLVRYARRTAVVASDRQIPA